MARRKIWNGPGFRRPRTLDAPARQAPRAPAGQCCTKRAPGIDVLHITLNTGGRGGTGAFRIFCPGH
eukprot:8670727-Lingulodinium_polyedra.AAC.1